MKCDKKISEMNWTCESTMRWDGGEEVAAYLDWDERRFYLWFEPTDKFADFCKEIDRDDLLVGLQNELAQIGVQEFGSLEGVNDYCKRNCGDDDPAMFYENEYGICGA